ncbi:hypothetical protein BAUCODRAFT_148129 [Baudoinia panamericana UAMH 10762]|uniref:Uncharacterized protein n=1 Tax=Baudoinia panamericana (strain UAMH 10762) TaxID=717646 RepID=M2LQ61_BAUPA|nr:uncharacterized protein BAUCODRAFT_148129 [Baudoinia panamericana UAMH 10762]EMC96532.1 hypothetical protein BAUCODRAFT_148129 [Baudoinia panamericana UAMH 10762]
MASPKQTQTPRAVARGKASALIAEFEESGSSFGSLSKFRDLHPTAAVLLFTPIIVPTGYQGTHGQQSLQVAMDFKAPATSGSKDGHCDTDPFETLGRAMSKQHNRIMHVPFVPSVGFTKTHEAFLAAGDAVLVVSCVPEQLTGGERSSIEAILAKQVEFGRAVANSLKARARQVPFTTFSFGSDDWLNEIAQGLNHVWVGDKYNADSIENILTLLFDVKAPKAEPAPAKSAQS